MAQKLGGGQYGEVYKGTYRKNGQAVAVKTFRVSGLSMLLSTHWLTDVTVTVQVWSMSIRRKQQMLQSSLRKQP